MFARFSRNSLVSRVIITVLTLSFVLAGAGTGTTTRAYAMRPKAAVSDGGRLGRIINDRAFNSDLKDGGLTVRTLDDLKTVVAAKQIDSGFTALDWNIKKVKKPSDLERIVKSLDTIEYVFKDMDAQYLYGLTHRARPKAGIFKQEESLKELVDSARALLKTRGLDDVIVELLPYDLNEAAQRIKDVKTQNPGRQIFFLFENIRFYEQEKSKDPALRKAFEQQLISLTNRAPEKLFYINEAFDKSHRPKESSMELVQLIPGENRAAGKALTRDLNAILSFLEKLTGRIVLVVGGVKFDKIEDIATIAELKGANLTIVLVGAQASAWRLFVQGLPIGASLVPSGEDEETMRKAFETIQKSGAQVIVAGDFTVGSLVKYKKEGEDQITVKDIVTGVQEIPASLAQVDIGPRSIETIRELAMSLKSGDGLIMNGGAGMFDAIDEQGQDIDILQTGTFELIRIGLAAKEKGIAVLGAGGDMREALAKFQDSTKVQVLTLLDYTTGGGVVWSTIANDISRTPEKMTAINAVLKPSQPGQPLADGGMSMTDRPLFLANHVALYIGPDTRTYNWEHAQQEGADGAIGNHSEDREKYELLFKAKAFEMLGVYHTALAKLNNAPRNAEIARKGKLDLLNKKARSLTTEEYDAQKAAIEQEAEKYVKVTAPAEFEAAKAAILHDFLKYLEREAGFVKDVISEAERNEKAAAWLDELFASTPGNEQKVVERFYRSVANKINQVKLRQVIASLAPGQRIEYILCIGETLEQYLAGRTQEVLREDIEEILEGFTPEELARIDLVLAYEPRWAIGTGKTPTNPEIQAAHEFIIAAALRLTGQTLPVLYGGSLNAGNARDILPLPGVAGGLIGGKALAPADMLPIIQIGLELSREKGKPYSGKIFYFGLNWKAAIPKPFGEFVKMFKDIDLNQVRISIGTPTVKLVKDEIQKPLDGWKNQLIRTAARARKKIADLREYILAESILDQTRSGKALDEMMKAITTVRLSGEVIEDSSGAPTVRAVITTATGITGVGEAPAGASKGKLEPATIDPATAVTVVIPRIAEELARSDLDLREYSEVKRAHDIIKAMFGNDYTELGGNTFTAVSWALFDLHAKLNNKELYQAIRDANPWWSNFKKGDLLFYANFLQHGLHAAKGAGEMGRDILEPQEIMYVALTRKFRATAQKLKGRLGETDAVFEGLHDVLTAQKDSGTIRDFFVGQGVGPREAGFSVSGLTDLEQAIDLIIAAAAKRGLKAGIDYLIALDIAATSFYNERTGTYMFKGAERTAEWMIDYYVGVVQRYSRKFGRNVIRSFEDPLWEDDFENHARLTLKLKPLGVGVIGDDLYCSQKERLRQGLRVEVDGMILPATSGILIKPNQAGNLVDVIETIQLAYENDMGAVYSHRSGETLYVGLAHLFLAFQGDALKAGAPQPAEFFPDPKYLVRRTKYEESINAVSRAATSKKTKVAAVSTQYLALAGVKALSKLDRLTDIQLIIYGRNAAWYATVLGAYGINPRTVITVKDAQAALEAADGIVQINSDMAFLKAPDEERQADLLALDGFLKQVVARGDDPEREAGKLVQMLYDRPDVDSAFAALDEQKQATVELSDSQRETLAQQKQGTYKFPEDVTLKDVSENVRIAMKTVRDFMRP